MDVEFRRPAAEYFFPALLIVAIAVTTAVFNFLGPVAGIKSTYVLLGLLFASVIYYTHGETPSTRTSWMSREMSLPVRS